MKNEKPGLLVFIEIILLLSSLLAFAVDDGHLAIFLLGLSLYFKLL